MSPALKWAAKALLPAYPAKVLSELVRSPVPWDQAAVDLHSLHSHAQRVGYEKYLYGLLSAARTARAVGAREFSAIEFGVAAGRGLVAMERHASVVEQKWGVSIRLVGFDTSSGLPQRTDPRDCPFAFHGGEFAMDEKKLRAQLARAELRLGDVADTVRRFASEPFPPIGFISNDLDLYTSTRDSFGILKLDADRVLPRVTVYFDDLQGYPYTTVTGEWAAINEFNSASESRKIGQVYGLRHSLGHYYRSAHWADSVFVLHAFDHPAYNSPETMDIPSLAI